MLIMPKKVQDKDILEFSPNITTKRKIAVSPNNNARIEEIIVDSKNKIVTKNCCIGYLTNDQVDICNKMQIITDINSGKRILF